jgi:hypothetical protein
MPIDSGLTDPDTDDTKAITTSKQSPMAKDSDSPPEAVHTDA